jgi:hypothetical protein
VTSEAKVGLKDKKKKELRSQINGKFNDVSISDENN